jgi:hypothetical protein
MAGGGVHGKGVGIARIIITGVGFIITAFQVFIMMWTRGGEDTTENIIGTVTDGTMNGFLTNDVDRTGRGGIIIDIGKGKEPGASRAINLDHNNRDRNSDIKGKSNTNRGLRFSDISNRFKSNKDKNKNSNTRGNHNTKSLKGNLI